MSSTFKELLKHGSKYSIADFFSKGLLFFLLPIITKLLPPSDFGFISVYLSIIAFISIFLKFGIQAYITRIYFDINEIEFYSFLKTIFLFIFIIDIVVLLPIIYFKTNLSVILKIPDNLFLFAILVSFFSNIQELYLAILQVRKQSTSYIKIQIFTRTLNIFIFLFFVNILTNNAFLSRPYADIIVLIPLGLFFLLRIIKLDGKLNTNYLKPALQYGFPLIPHALAGVALHMFDRIAINQLLGEEQTGIYSLAYQIGMIVNIVLMGLNRSWQPIFYDSLKNKSEQNTIKDTIKNYGKIIFILSLFIIIFAEEAVVLFIDKQYHSSANLIPIIVIGYFLLFLYTLYANYSFYFKKTSSIAIITVLASLLNIILNYVFIPKFGLIASAITTLISFFTLFLGNYIYCRYKLEVKTISIKFFILELFVLICAWVLLYVIDISIFHIVIIKVIFFITVLLFSIKHLWLKKLNH
jgi:O-antigen/teichoic acid export membrane protein